MPRADARRGPPLWHQGQLQLTAICASKPTRLKLHMHGRLCWHTAGSTGAIRQRTYWYARPVLGHKTRCGPSPGEHHDERGTDLRTDGVDPLSLLKARKLKTKCCNVHTLHSLQLRRGSHVSGQSRTSNQIQGTCNSEPCADGSGCESLGSSLNPAPLSCWPATPGPRFSPTSLESAPCGPCGLQGRLWT